MKNKFVQYLLTIAATALTCVTVAVGTPSTQNPNPTAPGSNGDMPGIENSEDGEEEPGIQPLNDREEELRKND